MSSLLVIGIGLECYWFGSSKSAIGKGFQYLDLILVTLLCEEYYCQSKRVFKITLTSKKHTWLNLLSVVSSCF